MNYIIWILYVVFLFAIIAAVTFLVTIPIFYFIRYLRKKINKSDNGWLTDKKLKYILASMIILFSAYSTYIAFYPNDSFYKNEFTDNTDIKFPKNAKIIVKGASYPDIHGDYSSSAVFKVDKVTIEKLIIGINANDNFKRDTISFNFGSEIRDQTIDFNPNKFNMNYYWNLTESYTYYFNVAFDTINNLVAFDRVSW